MRLSDRVGWIKPSATLAVAARAPALKRPGGAPNTPPPR